MHSPALIPTSQALYGKATGFAADLVGCAVGGLPLGPANRKEVVKSGDDLPLFAYPVKGSASGMVAGEDARFQAFAAKLRADLAAILRDYDIADKATMRDLLNEKLELQMLAGEYDAALHTVDQLHGEQEKPSAKLMVGNLRTGLVAGCDPDEEHIRAGVRTIFWQACVGSNESSAMGCDAR